MTTKLPSEISADIRISDQSAKQMRTIIDGYAQIRSFWRSQRFHHPFGTQ
jgi:hypothetical protein